MTFRSAVDPSTPGSALRCDDFGYGLGTPTGILVLRYTCAGRIDFGQAREDMHHQLYWCPDGLLVTNGAGRPAYVGPEDAFWAAKAVPHEVCALSTLAIYRICLRETPPGLRGAPAGPIPWPRKAAEVVRRLSGPGRHLADWAAERATLMAALTHETSDDTRIGDGRGYARHVMRALARNPADPTGLQEWAARLHCSGKTLQRDFVDTTGESFTAWRSSHRLSVARALLPGSAVLDVAAAVGYASCPAFVAAYRRHYGTTPGSDSRATQPRAPSCTDRGR